MTKRKRTRVHGMSYGLSATVINTHAWQARLDRRQKCRRIVRSPMAYPPSIVMNILDLMPHLALLLLLPALVGFVIPGTQAIAAETTTLKANRTYRNPIIDRIGPADPHVI